MHATFGAFWQSCVCSNEQLLFHVRSCCKSEFCSYKIIDDQNEINPAGGIFATRFSNSYSASSHPKPIYVTIFLIFLNFFIIAKSRIE